MSSPTTEARIALEAHDWERTLQILDDVADGGSLGPADLLLRADALYWIGEFDDAIEAFESAHAGFVAEGNEGEAGLIAALLAYFAFRRQSLSVARGWLARAHKLLDDAPESLGHAWMKLLHIGMALFVEGDHAKALAGCDEVIALAQQIGSTSAQSIAMSFKGLAMIQTGEWREGLQLMDEAMVVASSGSDNLRMTSDVYCNIIAACRNLGDFVRAEEWTEEAERWMRSQSVSGYTGVCQLHRAELKLLHGSWQAAEQEGRKARVELERFRILDNLGAAHYGIGEIRRRMGDLDTAEREFQEAYAAGHDAQPGLSLLMLDRGELEDSLASITSAAIRRNPAENDKTWRGPSRARLLPALVEIAIAAGDLKLGSSAAAEMAEIADTFDSAVWNATADACRGAVALASGNPDEALSILESARARFRHLDIPYEMARTQVLLAQARVATGDETRAQLDFTAARDVMRELGASLEVRRISELLGETDAVTPPSARVTRTFMFTDIVKSTDLISVIGDEQWRELLGWHDRTIRRTIENTSGEVVRHTGDGFFASFDDAREALDCAVEIQRSLRRHRQESGFALHVRIGLHRSEAMREGSDYSGVGVHAAARIGALAEGEQIIVSVTTLEAAGALPYATGESVVEELKGVSAPVAVIELDWR